MKVTAASLPAAGGHSGVRLTFTNTTAASCTLAGYPGVAGIDAQGRQVMQAKRTATGYLVAHPIAPSKLMLAPGTVAHAIVEGTNNPAGSATSCPTLAGLDITAPGTRHTHRVSIAPGACSGLAVHPVENTQG